MVDTIPFKRLILRVVLRHVSPMVIRLISVSDQTQLLDFHDVFRAVLGWSGDLGYIIRVHGQEFNSFRRKTLESTVRVPTASAGKVPLHLRHAAYVGMGRSCPGYSRWRRRRRRSNVCGRPRCRPSRVLRRPDRLPANAEAATRRRCHVRSGPARSRHSHACTGVPG